ncbi:MAG: SMC family ATPase [Anaerolineae bacterium]|nr:MAG: SMC family ATPase [Anaerolineae bacterium]
MIPIKLTLEGFLSYRDLVELDFTSFELACISGPNGAGKSSLLDAITWGLFGVARKRDDSLIHAQANQASVSFTFQYESNTYRVLRAKPRDKTSTLEFQIQTANGEWKPLTERSLRATEQKIEETLRLDYDTFVNASFFLQGKADQFTQQRPGDRKRILTSILGLEAWEAYRKGAFERRRQVETLIQEREGRLQEIQAELNEEEPRRVRLKELQEQLAGLAEARAVHENALTEMRQRRAALAEQEKLAAALAARLARARQTLEDMEARRAARAAEQEIHAEALTRAKEIEAAYAAWQAARAELEEWDSSAAQFHQHQERRAEPLAEIQREQARLEAEQESLLAEQEETAAAEAEQAELKAQLKELTAAAKTAAAQLAARDEALAAVGAAREALAAARAENPMLKAEMDNLKELIDTLDESDGADCPTCGQPLAGHARKERVAHLKAEGKERGDRYRANQALIKESETQLKALEKQAAEYEGSDEAARAATRALDQANDRLEQIAARLKEWKAAGAKRLKEVQKALDKETFAPEAHKTLAAIDAELKAIGYDAASHDAARKAEQAGRAADADLRALEKARAAHEPLSREVNELAAQIQTQQTEVGEQQRAQEDAQAALAAAQAQAPDVAGAETRLLELSEQENRMRVEVGGANQRVNVLADLKTRKAALEAEREELAHSVNRYKQLERAFGKDGVPAMLIEQALPQIETKANEILERLSGGGMSVRFVTQAEYKDRSRDDMRETLDIVISDAAGHRDYEMYSGGEAFRINFAIRLALSEVLAQRAGARLQTLVIDEGFGSQDEAGRQRLIEAINAVKHEFAKILVITHIDALKDAFPSRIEVEKTTRGSVVSVR